MGLLDKLWDETVAGPMPDSGLKKLRKHNNFSFRSVAFGKDATTDGGIVRSNGDDPTTPTTPKTPTTATVTRSIMIIKPPSPAGTPPASPAGSTPPVSPFFAVGFRSQVEGTRIGSGGSRRRCTREEQPGLEVGALVLLMTCDL
ncbi:hypothetical protein QJS10_CPB17g01270 [Acorus calamus]|uniref:Uncharacterized protein n=1 Tax=Acorus calamus TaxID=4465 RepID=A0AAV9D0I8_ACOCL|nr:hypothetical protein QJS10_CPB17g01270 [Acorus calamus]